MTNQTIMLKAGERLEKPTFETNSPNTLIQLFFASTDKDWLKNILLDIQSYYPNAVLIGASTDESINGSQISQSCATISISRFDDTQLSADFITSNADDFKNGKKLASKIIKPDTKAVIVFTDAASINGEELLKGMAKVLGNTVIAGGLASTKSFTDTFVIFQNKIIQNGAVAVSLNSQTLRVRHDCAFGWQAIGREMLITKADKHRIESINGKTPISIFRHYLGKKVAKGLLSIGSAFPLMVKRGDELVARGVIALDGESFIVSGNVNTGDKVHIGYGNIAHVIESNKILSNIAATLGQPEAVFSYYCIGRKFFLPRAILEFEAKNTAQTGNVTGFFTLGEFSNNDEPRHLNFSSTVLALSEGDKKEFSYKNLTPPKLDFINLVSEGLFNFIDTRTKELDYLAYHDGLTSLANKSLLADRTEHAISHAKRYGFKAALLFVDLDRFKIINDTLGHEIGDTVLADIAKKIQKTLRADDTLARIGGDEFAILLENIEGERHAAQLAARIIESSSKPTTVAGKKLSVTASIGIAMYPEDGDDYQTLIRNADAAMYQAKVDGRNGYAFYRKELTVESEKRLELQNELKAALKKGELTLYYQPQIDMQNDTLVGVEALIRWNHPKRGVLPPGVFLQEAEECGLMSQIGEIVINKACEQIKSWGKKGFHIPKVSINVTAEDFSKNDLSQKIHDAITRNGLSPEVLEVEITETGIMQNDGVAIGELKKLNDMGIRLSIDDFGTGYSSLSYLKRLPIKEIKIDRSFVSDITSDNGDRAIVRAILAISKELGLEVIAEGVETKKQAALLLKEGCRLGQGYLFGKPMPANEIAKLFRSNVSRS